MVNSNKYDKQYIESVLNGFNNEIVTFVKDSKNNDSLNVDLTIIVFQFRIENETLFFNDRGELMLFSIELSKIADIIVHNDLDQCITIKLNNDSILIFSLED